MVIPNIDWMNTSDPEILRFFEQHRRRIVAPPTVVAANCPLSESHARRRMRYLGKAGLLTQPEHVPKQGYYQITDLGERYLAGKCLPDELEERDPT